ncbi:alpha-L-fucosidase [Niabella hibiscisoli]|uniref:alpha-L-fucosidase n=1 Tax=Niabella hibiscisoli TaxID=1825928 RepID=UPI0021D4372F|nr:alpha-L-fucosidase [Niabella hibiscisoli]
MNKKLFLVLATVYILYAAAANAQNFVPILPTDTREDIIKKAAQVKPSARQLRWQQLELTAFFHFGINTFSNLEWGTGKEPASLFNPVKLDAMQWVKTMKEAGFRQVILTAKHHDGFCLWPTATTTYSIAQSPYKQGKGDIVKK